MTILPLGSETTEKYVGIYCARKSTTALVCKKHSIYEFMQIGAKMKERDIVRSSRAEHNTREMAQLPAPYSNVKKASII